MGSLTAVLPLTIVVVLEHLLIPRPIWGSRGSKKIAQSAPLALLGFHSRTNRSH